MLDPRMLVSPRAHLHTKAGKTLSLCTQRGQLWPWYHGAHLALGAGQGLGQVVAFGKGLEQRQQVAGADGVPETVRVVTAAFLHVASLHVLGHDVFLPGGPVGRTMWHQLGRTWGPYTCHPHHSWRLLPPASLRMGEKPPKKVQIPTKMQVMTPRYPPLPSPGCPRADEQRHKDKDGPCTTHTSCSSSPPPPPPSPPQARLTCCCWPRAWDSLARAAWPP